MELQYFILGILLLFIILKCFIFLFFFNSMVLVANPLCQECQHDHVLATFSFFFSLVVIFHFYQLGSLLDPLRTEHHLEVLKHLLQTPSPVQDQKYWAYHRHRSVLVHFRLRFPISARVKVWNRRFHRDTWSLQSCSCPYHFHLCSIQIWAHV